MMHLLIAASVPRVAVTPGGALFGADDWTAEPSPVTQFHTRVTITDLAYEKPAGTVYRLGHHWTEDYAVIPLDIMGTVTLTPGTPWDSGFPRAPRDYLVPEEISVRVALFNEGADYLNAANILDEQTKTFMQAYPLAAGTVGDQSVEVGTPLFIPYRSYRDPGGEIVPGLFESGFAPTYSLNGASSGVFAEATVEGVLGVQVDTSATTMGSLVVDATDPADPTGTVNLQRTLTITVAAASVSITDGPGAGADATVLNVGAGDLTLTGDYTADEHEFTSVVIPQATREAGPVMLDPPPVTGALDGTSTITFGAGGYLYASSINHLTLTQAIDIYHGDPDGAGVLVQADVTTFDQSQQGDWSNGMFSRVRLLDNGSPLATFKVELVAAGAPAGMALSRTGDGSTLTADTYATGNNLPAARAGDGSTLEITWS